MSGTNVYPLRALFLSTGLNGSRSGVEAPEVGSVSLETTNALGQIKISVLTGYRAVTSRVTYLISKCPSTSEGQVEDGVSVLSVDEDEESLMSDADISES